MAGRRTRLSIVEYGAPVDLSQKITDATGFERGRANQLLLDAGARAASSLGVSANPISVEPKGTKATDIAGLIRLGPSLELEIAPKFLGLDDVDARWREDFFFLSTLSRHGRLLASERLLSSGGAPRDLSTLVARAISDMYQARKRRPLRAYRRVRESSFFIDGDPDPIDLIFPGPDGFDQESIYFDRGNVWNATICAAAQELLPEVSDPSAAASLTRVIEELSPQRKPRQGPRRRVPSRHRAWQPLYEISWDVLRGLGMTYQMGQAHAPGFVVATWQIWEDLLTIGLRIGLGRDVVSSQARFELGARHKPLEGAASSILSVFPDCVVRGEGGAPQFLVDAKYKGHVESGSLRIAESDIYEALAFARATGCNYVVLAYPASPSSPPSEPGSCAVFECVDVGEVRIIGIQVEVRGIAKRGALRTFSKALVDGMSKAVESGKQN